MADTQAQRDAFALISSTLEKYGLGSLSGWAKQEIQRGASPEEISLSLYDQPAFKQRFPAIEQRTKAGLPAVTPEQYVQLESSYRETARLAGLPPGFYDNPNDFTRLISADVSPREFQARIQDGFQKVTQADPSVRQAFTQYFGVKGDNALAAWFMDPTKATPVLQQQANMAEVAGIGHQAIGGWLTEDRARQLVQSGVSADQARAGFSKLADMAPLFTETISEHQDLSAQEQGVSAVFGVSAHPVGEKAQEWMARGGGGMVAQTGTSPAPDDSAQVAAQQIEQRRQARTAAFKGGGEAAAQQGGVTGLGSSS